MDEQKAVKIVAFVIVCIIVIALAFALIYNNQSTETSENNEINNQNTVQSQPPAFANVDNTESAREVNESLADAIDNGYVQNVDMDYVYNNEIGVKVSSYTISDYDFTITLDFDFKNKPISNNGITAKMIVYDENKNIYCDYSPMNQTNSDFAYKEPFYNSLGIEYNEDNPPDSKYSGSQSSLPLIENSDYVKSQYWFTSNQTEYPRSKKLYVYVHDIGYLYNDKFNYLYKDLDWTFELDVPEMFYNRTNSKYQLAESIEGFELNDFTVTDTGTSIKFTSNSYDPNVRIVLSDGSEYKSYSGGASEDRSSFVRNYHFNKHMITDKLYLKVNTGTESKQVELVKVSDE